MIAKVAQRNLDSLKEDSQIAQLLNTVSGFGSSLILGGAIRDWFFGNPPKDIDIVVDCPASKLEALNEYSNKKNKFGGHKLTVGKTDFDIWSWEHSWALMNNPKFNRGLETITQAVFFNMDAIGYRLDTGEVVDNGFKAALESKTLDIVYEPNPFPFLQVSKALIMLKKYGLAPSVKLRSYVEGQQARGYNQGSFVRYQKLNYGDEIYNYDECMRAL